MRIILKKGTKKCGYLKNLNHAFKLEVIYRNHPEFFIDLQKLLLKHFDVGVICSKKITNKLILDEIKETQKNKKGCKVGYVIRQSNKRKNDEEYRNKRIKIDRDWRKRNKEKERARAREYERKLSEYKNKRCIRCDKLLHSKTKGDLCRGCMNKKV